MNTKDNRRTTIVQRELIIENDNGQGHTLTRTFIIIAQEAAVDTGCLNYLSSC